MAGHSKWAQIKHKKGVNDKQRAALFTKLSHLITIAVKEGGGANPEFNPRLRFAIDQAREASMPKDNIQRAIERGEGADKNTLSEFRYEAFGQSGTVFILVGATDNMNRSHQEIRSIIEKRGGKMGSVGSALYLFKKNEQTHEYEPLYTVELTAEEQQKTRELVDVLLDQADILHVYTNAVLPDV